MGTSAGKASIEDERMDDYVQLSYLSKSEIMRLRKRFWALGPQYLDGNYQCRFPFRAVLDIFPEFKVNPYCDRLFKVFSSLQDDHLSFEDVIDLFSILSERCPDQVKALWAFRVYDFDGDSCLSVRDIEETIDRLNGSHEGAEMNLNRDEIESLSRKVVDEMDMDKTGYVTKIEFAHAVTKMPDFAGCFCVKS